MSKETKKPSLALEIDRIHDERELQRIISGEDVPFRSVNLTGTLRSPGEKGDRNGQ